MDYQFLLFKIELTITANDSALLENHIININISASFIHYIHFLSILSTFIIARYLQIAMVSFVEI